MATESTPQLRERYEAPGLTVLGTFQELTMTGKIGTPQDVDGHNSGGTGSPIFAPRR